MWKENEKLYEIDELINNFVAQFDCEAELGDEFLYFGSDNTITYTLLIGELSDRVWKKYIKDNYNYEMTNVFLFSLLHEIGHHHTMGQFSRKLQNDEDKKVARIEKDLSHSNCEELDTLLYLEYYDLPMEKVATEWAVKYAKNHKRKLFRFWRKLEIALHQYFSEVITE